MKKVLITFVMMLTINSALTQNAKSVITHCINTAEVTGPTGVVCSNELKTKWFTITPLYKLDNDILSCYGLLVIKTNIGITCKKATLVFSFKDGDKLWLRSNYELKPYSSLYFEISELEFLQLKSKEIDYVRYINGIDNESFLYKMNENEVSYYVDLFNDYYIQKTFRK
jgi:hypothetical protein